MEQSVLKKKFIRAFFWCVLIYTAISSTMVWLIQCGWVSMSPRQYSAASHEHSIDLTPSVCSFSERFAREYLFWTQGKEAMRVERLKPLMATNIDPQAGLHTVHAQWDSYVTYANVWDAREHPGNSSVKDITVYAETVMTKVDHPREQKRINRYLVLSIQKVGSTFMIVDTPYLIPAPLNTPRSSSFMNIKKGERISDQEYVEVENFAKSFLKVYTTGEAQEIGYFLKNKQPHSGLTGVVEFLEMRELSAYQEKEAVRVECDVVFRDLQSGANLLYHIRLMLAKEGKQWYVLKIEQGGIT